MDMLQPGREDGQDKGILRSFLPGEVRPIPASRRHAKQGKGTCPATPPCPAGLRRGSPWQSPHPPPTASAPRDRKCLGRRDLTCRGAGVGEPPRSRRGSVRRTAAQSAWLSNLRRRLTRYVYLGSLINPRTAGRARLTARQWAGAVRRGALGAARPRGVLWVGAAAAKKRRCGPSGCRGPRGEPRCPPTFLLRPRPTLQAIRTRDRQIWMPGPERDGPMPRPHSSWDATLLHFHPHLDAAVSLC
ncbi:uncharacterized protein LOC110346313 [Heterocephalus glaber]|uniref:Uncharacterized protein LOC110344665 n=1 Tax=Heterocephalus glaber TaxID=10181 RepID=A0AAX6RGM3_HETGA|nr:uncharacterized protein LOC110344665 [Heterocephalus glaber]XP_021102527.1 uncharacterized protein LOC110346313 [Heterocephalus glaber]